jgi:hypothetical protein
MTLTNPIAYSPITTLAAGFAAGATSLTVVEHAVFPDAPFYAVLTHSSNVNFQSNDPDHYETILVETKNTVTLSDITRVIETKPDSPMYNSGLGGTWLEHDYIACFWTAQAYKDFKAILDGATSAATASKLMVRDADGRARVAAPSDNTDIARKLEVDARLALAGGTMTGTLAMNDNLITMPDIKDYVETLATATWNADNGTQVINLQNGNVHKVSIADYAVTDLTFTNPRAGSHSFTLILTQGDTLMAVAWPASVKWAGDSPPTMAINKTYWITFATLNSGTDWTGFLAGEV